MLESVFNSKSKVAIIKFMVENRGKKFTVSEIARKCKLSKSQVSIMLRELQPMLLDSESIGRSLVYTLDTNTPFKRSIAEVFEYEKKVIADIEKNFVKKTDKRNIANISVFGSSLQGLKARGDIDILVVYKGDISKDKFYSIAAELTSVFGFEVSLTFLTLNELKKKNKEGEKFVIDVIANSDKLYGKNLEDLLW